MLISFFVRIEFFRRVGSPACTMRSISSGPKCGGQKCATNKTRTTDTAKCEYSSDLTLVSFCVSAIQLENGANHSRIFFLRLFESFRSWKDMGNFAMCSQYWTDPDLCDH